MPALADPPAPAEAADDGAARPTPPPPGEAVISVRGLTKTYRDGLFGRRKVHALRGVDLSVGRGEIYGLLGPNGAGKTTLIKVLLGICRKSGGEATVLGHAAGARAARGNVGYLPEGHRLPRHLTANTALDYYGGLSGLSSAEVKRRRGELLELVGLGKGGPGNVRKFSKGMQQRLGLAQAMLHDPDLLILDEPTDGVDPVGRADIRRVLAELKARGKTVFLNSHLLQELELVCDRAAILRDGEVRRVGTLDEVRGAGRSGRPEDVLLRVVGPREAIDRWARDLTDAEVRPLGDAADGAARAEVKLPGPARERVDAAVDALRSAGVSLHSLTRERATLEEAFLEIVADDARPGGVRQAGGVTG